MSKEENVKNNPARIKAEQKVERAKITLAKSKSRLSFAIANGGVVHICRADVQINEDILELRQKELDCITRIVRRASGLPKEEAAYKEVSEFNMTKAVLFLTVMFSIMAVCVTAALIIGSA